MDLTGCRMSTDWVEKEREFLSNLKADTGRDLAEWLAAIRAQNLPHRNDIIDWLRQQGFPFSRASWLERIHNNGGRPIYLDPAALLQPPADSPPSAPPPAKAEPPPTPVLKAPSLPAAVPTQPVPPTPPAVTPAKPPPSPPPAAPSLLTPSPQIDEVALEALLARAKAYRPLALYVLREIKVVLPDMVTSAEPGYVSLANPREFAILAISSKELKLGLDLGNAPGAAALEPARFPPTMSRAAARMSRMVILNDARQIDDGLLALIKMASERVNA